MLRVLRDALCIFLVATFFLSGSSRAETPEKKPSLRFSAFELRGDPAVEHRFSANFTDWLLERTRSIVARAGAQRESVGQRWLKFVDEAAAQTTTADSSKAPEDLKESTRKTAPMAPTKPQTAPGAQAMTPESRSKASSPAKSATPVDTFQEQENTAGKSPSILQMLEGHETELMIAAAIAATFFLIGWICGGHYSLRRDRRRRTKIRF